MRFSEVICALALTASFTSGVMAQQKGGQGQAAAAAAKGKGNGQQAQAAQAAAAANAAKANGNNNNNAAAAAAAAKGNGNNNNAAAAAGAGSLTLLAANVQKASDATGQGAGSEAGQAASKTDAANFINVCSGKTLTNGAQVKGGSCNGIPMGDIPASTAMISSIITNPKPGDTIAANQDINFQVQVQNLVAGSFTNPQNTYYAAPQALQGGKIVGHTHITVQQIGSLTTTTPPDPAKFAFFKGINDAGNGNGALSAVATGGLPAGVYRVCTMTSASNHQPVLMPVAQRGAQDDCTKFTVSNGGAAAAGGNANKGNGNAAAAAAGTAAAAKGTAAAAKGNGNAAAAGGKGAGNNAAAAAAGKGAGNAAAAAGGKGAGNAAAAAGGKAAGNAAAAGGAKAAGNAAAAGGAKAAGNAAAGGAAAAKGKGGKNRRFAVREFVA